MAALPWDSPGKNTGVGCHFPLQCMKVKSESEVTLVPENGGRDTVSEQEECLDTAAQICARRKETTWSLPIYYICVSILPTANKRKEGGEGGRILGFERQSLI